jgi:hypothetical protein
MNLTFKKLKMRKKNSEVSILFDIQSNMDFYMSCHLKL